MTITRFMSETVKIRPFGSESDGWHDASYGSATDYKARVEDRQEVVKTSDGEEKLSVAQVYIEGDVSVGMRDEVELPDGRTADILKVNTYKRPNANVHHTKIWLE